MKPLARLFRLAYGVVFLPVLISCGGGSSGFLPNQAASAVSVSLSEHYVTVSGGETHQFVASVSGSSNTKVIWSVSGCTGDTCGSIGPSGLYTAPSVVSAKLGVTVTAAAEADSSRLDQASVQLVPITVTISPTGAWVVPGGTQAFTASVRYDSHHAGVAWVLGTGCSDNCGALSNVAPVSVTYTAPATAPGSSLMKLTASSVSDPSKKAEIPITLAATGGMADGDYTFVFNGWETPISNGYYWMHETVVAGRFHADAQGNITQGVQDINALSGVIKALPFTGNYSVGADGRGSFTFMTARGNATYHMVLDVSQKKGKFIRYDALQPDSPIFGSGYFELQDQAAFSLPALAGPYAFGVFGTLDANRLAAVGRLDADASGAFTGGSADAALQVHGGNDLQASSTNLKLAGLLGSPSASTGRGTAVLNWGSPYNFAYYIISNQKIVLVQIDERNSTTPVLSGEARRQKGPFSAASFNAPAIFSMAGANRSGYGDFHMNAAVGQMVPDASGSVTGIYDDNQGSSDQPFTGSYTIEPNGRSALQTKRVSGETDTHVAYFFSPNEAWLVQTSGTDVLFGRLKPQTAGPFTAASLSEAFLTNSGPPGSEQAENVCGLTTFDGLGGISSTTDLNIFGNLSNLDFNGTYEVAPDGRGTLIYSSPASGQAVFWVISPTEIVSAGAITGNPSYAGTLLEYER